jgi:hypothetical protein
MNIENNTDSGGKIRVQCFSKKRYYLRFMNGNDNTTYKIEDLY